MRAYNPDDFLMLSGIQHYVFCKRQWALIHIEHQWAENLRTVEGNIMHKRAHSGPTLESRKDILISREMPVFSASLGINGICDVVEFYKCDSEGNDTVKLHGKEGFYRISPVEYKKGAPKIIDADRLQMGAQVMCLEEMFCTKISEGFLFYGATKHREKVYISESIRESITEVTYQMHQLYDKG